MVEVAKDILLTLKILNKNVYDITDIEGDYDIRSQNFVDAFQFLENSNYIKAVTRSCGLEVSADGFPSWSADPFTITESGENFVNPAMPRKESFTKHPLFVAIVSGVVVAAISIFYFQPWQKEAEKKVDESTMD